MSRKRSDTSRSVGHHKVDDFKLINGIGPAVEKRLHDVGIFTFARLAALSPADIAAAVAGISGLTTERIINQDWIGQARRLMTGPISSEVQKEGEAPARLIEASASGAAAKEVVSPDVAEPELTAPAAEEAEPALPVAAEPEPVTPVFEEAEPEPVTPVFEEEELAPPVAAEPEPVAPVFEEEEPAPPVSRDAEVTLPTAARRGLSGILRLRDLETIPAHARGHQSFLPYGQPFDARLTLDLSDVVIPGGMELSYKMSIFGKKLEDHSRRIVAEIGGIVTSTDKLTVSVKGIALPGGTYRLKAMVILSPVTTEPTRQASLVASKESDLLLIF